MTISLTASNIHKSYGAVQALRGADLQIEGGEVVALLGANGSGKSTLGKIITGIVKADEGKLTLDGGPLQVASPIQARRLGITAVYQELSLVPGLSVAENIALGHEPVRFGGLDRRSMEAQAARLLDLFDGCMDSFITPHTTVEALPPSERQVVEILKAISLEPRVLILDEATASLDGVQVERLFELVREWRDSGMAVAFISHRMEEIFRIADRAVVLRNGETVGERVVTETEPEQLVDLMTGGTELAKRGKAATDEPLESTTDRAPALTARGLATKGVSALDLEVRAGELLGLGGLQGQGQEQILLALFGAIPHRGEIGLNGRSVRLTSPRAAMHNGVAYVPGDRGTEGLLPIRPIIENLHIASWKRYGFPLKVERARNDAARVGNDLNIKYADLSDPVNSLSGGNAQKVVIGKWLLRYPKVLLLNDPTKGIDVGAKAEFYALLDKLKAQGAAIILHSSDDEELLSLCDRVVVLRDGRVTGVLESETLVHERLVSASLGSAHAEAPPPESSRTAGTE